MPLDGGIHDRSVVVPVLGVDLRDSLDSFGIYSFRLLYPIYRWDKKNGSDLF